MNATPVYPVGLRLRDRRVVVVGGGQVAHRRVAGLLEAGAQVTVVSPEVTPALEALVGPGSLTWIRRRYERGDLDGAWYAVAATDDPDVNAAVTAEADEGRIFCARADDRRGSSVWTPAIGRHDDVVVGVHGGGDPQRAIGIRDAVVAGLTDGSIADRASRTPGGRTPRRRRPRGGRARRSGTDHGARPPGALPGRRDRGRPPRAAGAALLAPLRRRGHRRLEAAARAVDGAGADQHAAGRARPRRASGWCASRAGTRSSSAGGWRSSRPAWPRASRSRSCPG